MLYLAKVCKRENAGELVLQPLARQKSEHFWVLLSDDSVPIELTQPAEAYREGGLVLVEMSTGRQVTALHDATDWVLSLIDKYLTTGITPEILHQEAERVEAWRKDLTLQNQDLARRVLEIETRRDQIQELEKKLEVERQQLEALRARLNGESNGVETGESDVSPSPVSDADADAPAGAPNPHSHGESSDRYSDSSDAIEQEVSP